MSGCYLLPCAVYRASFPKTFKELGKSDGHYAKVVPGVLIGMAVGAWLATFLRKTSMLPYLVV